MDLPDPVLFMPRRPLARACLLACGAALAACLALPAAAAEGRATADEAVALVRKGVAFLRSRQDKEAALAEIGNAKGAFVDRDLYLMVYRMDGMVLAHGAVEKKVGRNLMDITDSDGKHFVRERMELARRQPSFWQDYKQANPVTHRIEPKSTYCERLDDMVVCGGIYKP